MAIKKEPLPPPGQVPSNVRGSSGRPSTRASLNPDDLALRRQKSLELRLKGYQLREIAAIVGVSAQVVHLDIKTLIAQNLSQSDIEHGRALEEERLDKLLQTAMEIVSNARADKELRLKAIDRVVRISNQRAQLLGLNAPVRHDVNVTERTQQDLELEELLNEAKARNAVTAAQLQVEVGADDPAGA